MCSYCIMIMSLTWTTCCNYFVFVYNAIFGAEAKVANRKFKQLFDLTCHINKNKINNNSVILGLCT